MLMPAHVVEYSYMTETFRVFINGCTGQAYGIQQQSIVSAVLNVINKASGTIVPALEAVLKVSMRQLPPGDCCHLMELQGARLPAPVILAIINFLMAALRPMVKILFWPPFFVGALLTLGAFSASKAVCATRAEVLHSLDDQYRFTDCLAV